MLLHFEATDHYAEDYMKYLLQETDARKLSLLVSTFPRRLTQ